MSIQPAVELPQLIHVHRHADNHTSGGARFYPDAQFFTQVVAAKAHCVAFARKLLFSKHYGLGVAGGASGVTAYWHCKIGAGCKRIIVYVVLGLDDRVTASEPSISVAVTRVSTAAVTTLTFAGGESTTAATDAPDEFIIQGQGMAVTAGEIYTGTVTHTNDARLISILVYEEQVPTVDDANPPHQEWSPSAGSPVLDGEIERVLDGVGDMQRLGGGLRFDWSRQNGAARTRTANTWINLIDNASSSPPTASSPGPTFDTRYRNTISKTTVTATFAVFASITGGGSGTVRLRDTGGTDRATVTVNNGTAQWFTATATLPVGATVKLDPGFQSDGVNTLSVYAVCLYENG